MIGEGRTKTKSSRHRPREKIKRKRKYRVEDRARGSNGRNKTIKYWWGGQREAERGS